MQDRLAEAGAQVSHPPKYAPIFVAATLTGLYSQRHVFHDPSNIVTQRFYGGRPDTLWDGLNVELSNELTLIRRFGTSQFSGATYPQAPTVAFSFELENGSIQVVVDTPSFVYVDNQDGTKTTIFTKSAGAGQGYFVASGNTLYYGDGVDQLKYTPGNPNGISWLWGIAAPIAPPSVTIVASGSSAVAWAASTIFSTMGFTVDVNGNVQQLYSVNALGNNSTQIGETGNGQPNFSTGYNTTTTDGSVTWTSQGQIRLWAPNTTFQPGEAIYDPGTNCIFISSHNFAITTGTQRPAFNSVLGLSGARVIEPSGGGKWENIGQVNVSPTAVLTWRKNTAFNQYVLPSSGSDPTNVNSAIVFPLVPFLSSDGQLCGGQATYLLGASVAGTTANTNYTPWNGISSQAIGAITQDNQLLWICQGPAAWAATTAYTQWVYGNSTFSVIKDSNGNMQVCIASGTSAGSAPTWETAYGSQTIDGTVTWVCTGPPVTWAPNTNWYLPSVGFAPPLPSQAYGGAAVIGSGFVQFVISSGLSGGSAPSWSTTVGNTTTDNGITWITVAAASSQGITWTKSHVYAYSLKCRTPTDNYVTTALLTFAGLNTPQALTALGNVPGLTSALGPYQGGGTGAISTASPVYTISSPNTAGAVNTIGGFGSTDPQVDTVVIWRDADGGGADNMFELIEIPAPKPIAGVAQPWQFKDFLPDIPSTVGGINYPGLDNLIPAPIDDQNDPPPAGFRPLCDQLHFSRVFGAIGDTVFFSGGPDVLTGNPNEAFNPDDDFPFESTVIACIRTPAGLICPTTTDFECIYGGPSTASFYDNTMIPGVGMLSYNAWDIHAGELYFLSADSQFYAISPSLQLARVGFPVGNKIKTINAANAYVTVHESGTDNAIYLGDGSTGWYRLNPHQVGADVGGENVAVWSPKAGVVGGCQMLQSVVTAPGVRKLLVGGTGTNQHILMRDTTVFSDNGSAYSAWADIGAITMVFPGQRAAVKFLEADFESRGTQPLVSYVLDDPTPSPSWNLMTNFVFDPPIVYQGTAITPNYWPDRFYLSQNASVGIGRRIRLKVDFGSTDTVRNELISFAIWGRKYSEG